jgi:hypothetical protein
MKKLTFFFSFLVVLFVYKLAFLSEPSIVTTENKFAIFRDNYGVPHVYAK